MNSTTTKSEDSSPSCWICLCDEPDDDGKSPVRDCSCRGDTGAGYAHLSCLVKYAQTKSRESSNNQSMSNDHFMNKLFEAWQRCPNCEQKYQHQLALDLADSLVSFVKGKISELICSGDYLLVAASLQVKMDAIKANIRGPNELDFITQGLNLMD